jgi:hypothetical protein
MGGGILGMTRDLLHVAISMACGMAIIALMAAAFAH